MSSYALIVDPDVAAAFVFASAAREEGLTYISVRDGARAFAVLAERGMPELLVTEVALPDLDGLELVERIRRTPSGEAPAVVVVSAHLDARERASALRARLELGAVLSKAASVDSIRRVIRRLRGARPVPDARSSEVRVRGRPPGASGAGGGG
jgi:CheY-like chemotaxis protein